jgi:hypothetical protein
MTTSTDKPERASWGAASGLLAGCGLTLIGVIRNLSPDIILIRALAGGAIVALVASIVSAGLRLAVEGDRDD